MQRPRLPFKLKPTGPPVVVAPPVVTLTGLTLTGGTVNEGASRTLVLTGAYSNNTTAVLTSGVTWSSNAPGGVFAVPANAITGDGYTATVTASYGGFTATAQVTVVDTTVVVTPTPTPTPTPTNALRLVLTFDKAPTSPSVSFNKSPFGLAKIWNITFDDEALSDRTIAAPVLWGGVVNGVTYPGAPFDDGTGHLVEAGFGSAINGAAIVPVRDQVYGQNIAEDDIDELYKHKGYVDYNHTFRHAIDSDGAGPDNAYLELKQNQDYVKNRFGVDMRVYVVPGGEAGALQTWFTTPEFNALKAESQSFQVADGYNVEIAGNRITPDRGPLPGNVYPTNDGRNFDWCGILDPQRQIVTRRNHDGNFKAPGSQNGSITDFLAWVDEEVDWANARSLRTQSPFFTHGLGDAGYFAQGVNYMMQHPRLTGRAGIVNSHQTAEYAEGIALAVIGTPQVSGSTVTVDVDLSQLKAVMRYRNFTFNVSDSSGAKLTGVSVQGSTSFTYNLATGLINSYQMKGEVSQNPVPTTQPTAGVDADPFLATWDSAPGRVSGDIPYDAVRDAYYLDNFHDAQGFPTFADGSTQAFYSPDEQTRLPSTIRISLRKYRAKAGSIRAYVRAMSGDLKVYYTPKGSTVRQLFGTLVNGATGWQTLTVPTPVDAVSLEMDCPTSGDLPSEFLPNGSYVPAAPFTRTKRRTPLRQHLAANGFVYDFPPYQDNRPVAIQNLRQSYNHLRLYAEWSQFEPIDGNNFYFAPSWPGSGSFDFDKMLLSQQQAGLKVRICPKSVPDWMYNTWPTDNQARKPYEQIPIFWAGTLAATLLKARDPKSYLRRAQMGFQVAARYGKTVVADNLLRVHTGDPDAFHNQVKRTGLNLVDAFEMGNENTSPWLGRPGYTTAYYEMAPLFSAMYDGHMGTMGPDAGIKTADPTMTVFTAGDGVASPEILRGLIDWCRENRGYKPDGSVNLCFDVYSYHQYSNNAAGGQYGQAVGFEPTRGMAPELSGWVENMERILAVAAEYAPGLVVNLGESGFDISQFSSQAALRPIDFARDASGRVVLYRTDTDAQGNVTETTVPRNPDGSPPYGGLLPRVLRGADRTDRKLVQAQWMLRGALLGWEAGLDSNEVYMAGDAGNSEFTQYNVCGMADANELRPSARFFYQALHSEAAPLLAGARLSSDPVVIELRTAAGVLRGWWAWVGDERARTAPYTFPIPTGGATSYVLDPATLTPFATSLAAGQQTLTLTETPCLVLLPA